MKGWPPRTWRLRDWAVAVLFLVLAVGSAVAVTWLVRHAWAVHQLTRGVGDTVFLSADGRPWFRMDEARRDVPLSEIAPALRQAVIAVEDHRFYQHPGIDPLGLARAMFRNVRSREMVEGGSTITQQLARTLFLSNQRTWHRKAKEAVLALMLEHQLTKDQILELYLNRVYISGGMYGVEPLSRKLFGKPAARLTLAESALVAGLIRAPSSLSPWWNLEGAKRRSHVVLRRMREAGFISAAEERRARAERIRIRPWTPGQDPRAGYAKDYLRQQFRNLFGGDHPPDWKVHTTFVPELQDAAERAVRNGLARARVRGLEAALVAVEPATGNILAMVGGHDYSETPFNRAVKSRRQPGSAFKPILFAAALERGWSPVSELSGLSTLAPQGREEWTPRNVSGTVEDRLTLRQALLESNNRAAVALLQQIGRRPVLRLASDVGMGELPDVPSLALGTGLVTPLELTMAYATFANGGIARKPRSIARVVDADGNVAWSQDIEGERVLSEETAFQMVSMLADVVDRGTASAARSLGVRFAVGGKTGTTNGFKDAWFVGFSSSVVVGVWVGFDQPATIRRDGSGARLALPIWAEFMRTTARRLPARPFEPPATLHDVELCAVSYQRPVEGCPTYVEYLRENDNGPGRLCTIHEGSLKQRARRAIEGFFASFGRRIRDVFR